MECKQTERSSFVIGGRWNFLLLKKCFCYTFLLFINFVDTFIDFYMKFLSIILIILTKNKKVEKMITHTDFVIWSFSRGIPLRNINF